MKKTTDIDLEAHDVPHALNIFFPGKCNLQCVYCFVHKEKNDFNDIDEKALKKEIDIFFNYPGKRKNLSFNGGEPLLEWNLIKNVYAYAKRQAEKKKLDLEVMVVTNGTLLKQEHVDFFKKNKITVRVSIDGNKETHDKSRPFKARSGKSSFDAIMENIGSIKIGSLKLSASLVFGPETVDSLFENIKFLQQKGFECIDFYPQIYATWNSEKLEALKNQAREIARHYENIFKNKNGKPFKISMLGMILNGSDVGKQGNCGKIQTDAVGNFYACDKVFSLPKERRNEYLVGNVNTGINDRKRSLILNNLRKEFSKETSLGCASCRMKKYCFCPLGQYVYMKDASDVDSQYWKSFCAVSKIIIKMHLRLIKKLEYDELFVKLNRF